MSQITNLPVCGFGPTSLTRYIFCCQLRRKTRESLVRLLRKVPIPQNESILDLLSWDFSRLSEIYHFFEIG